MKTISKILITVVLVLVGVMSLHAERIMKDAASINGVTSVYVGKSALRLAGSVAPIDGIDLKYLTGVEVLSAETPEPVRKLKDSLAGVLKSYRPRLNAVVETREDGESMTIYAPDSDNNILNCLIIVEEEPNELNIIVVSGEIPADKIGNMILK